MENNIKKNLFLIIISLLFILQIKCYEKPDEEEIKKGYIFQINHLNKMLEDFEDELDFYKTINYALIGLIILFLLIIISFLIYEIVACCRRRKKDIIRQTIIASSIKKAKFKNSKKNSKNFNLKLSSDSFSSTEEDIKEGMAKSKNSFHSSHLEESNRQKEDINIKNSFNQSNLGQSNYVKERNNSGYEAPIVEGIPADNNINIDNNEFNNYNNDNNNEEKILTNEGKSEDNNNAKLLDNPY